MKTDRIFLGTTRGICPVCNDIADAKIYAENNRVYLEKYCIVHGKNAALISSDYDYYKQSHQYIRPGQMQKKYFGDKKNGCPLDCGLCPDHEQHICMPVLEITGNCNLNCPICIAHENHRQNLSIDDVKSMTESLLASETRIDVLNISGGEPMIHPEYKEIIEYLLSVDQITKLSVSTNGLMLLEQDDLLDFHKERSVIISLQLDGSRKETYTRLRGKDLLEKKQRIVDLLLSRDLVFSLITTIARGINDTMEDIKYVYDLFIENENILSLLFQPLVYKKMLASTYNVMDRITIPDVIGLVSEASGNAIAKYDFMPLPCCNANCFSLVHLLQYEDNRFIPFKRLLNRDRYIETIKNRSFFGSDEESFDEIKDTIFALWTESDNLGDEMKETSEKALKSIRQIIKDIRKAQCECGTFNSGKTFDIASRKIKSIFIHHFMDADTFDLTRVRRCCSVYPKPDGRFYPMCTYNNIYRDK